MAVCTEGARSVHHDQPGALPSRRIAPLAQVVDQAKNSLDDRATTVKKSPSSLNRENSSSPPLRYNRITTLRRLCWPFSPSPAGHSRAAIFLPTARRSCGSSFSFFASAAASSAYLTVSELFPLEIRRSPSRSSFRLARLPEKSSRPGCLAG